MSSGKGDADKARYWQRTIRQAVRRGMSIREFLPAASAEGESVLLVAAPPQGVPALCPRAMTPSTSRCGAAPCRSRTWRRRWNSAERVAPRSPIST
jgi:hypothetical protein